MRDAYGRTPFGAGCLLARRLVEAGVTFVEVNVDGWDTHDDNFTRTADRNGMIDQPMAQLITDLGERGMLERTLVDLDGRVRPHAADQRRGPAATTIRGRSTSRWPAAASAAARSSAKPMRAASK